MGNTPTTFGTAKPNRSKEGSIPVYRPARHAQIGCSFAGQAGGNSRQCDGISFPGVPVANHGPIRLTRWHHPVVCWSVYSGVSRDTAFFFHALAFSNLLCLRGSTIGGGMGFPNHRCLFCNPYSNVNKCITYSEQPGYTKKSSEAVIPRLEARNHECLPKHPFV